MRPMIPTILAVLIAVSTTALAQNFSVPKEDFEKTMKQIADSLPAGWSVKTDTAYPGEIIIQSAITDLLPDMTSNDPADPKGPCRIFILIMPRVSPDSIASIHKRNNELQSKLPPQNSKGNLKEWYQQNQKTLKLLDTEPTHYDVKYSYRIKCSRLPKFEKDISVYNNIRACLNRRYKRYFE
jgi:hypothetical protein